MNMPYFYEPSIAQPHHILSEETSKHCAQVLRMKEGEQLQLTDGNGKLFTAVLTRVAKKQSEADIINVDNKVQTNSNASIAISLLKNPSRLEWFMEKATEIGVREIQPLICAHTEKENFRFDRMNSILISAMLQSKQIWLPQLHQLKNFDAFVEENFNGLKLIAHCAEGEKQTIKDFANQITDKVILIGPEGDFSLAEIESALKKNFIAVSLGNTRLRSETAGIVAATLLCNN